MRITLYECGALDLTLQLADAAQQLMVELTFCDQFLRLTLKGLLGEFEFFRQRGDQRLRVGSELSGQLFDLILKTCDETKDNLRSLIKESKNG